MDCFVECLLLFLASASKRVTGDTAPDAAKMAPITHTDSGASADCQQPQTHCAPAAVDPASLAVIAKELVALLTLTITEAVDQAVLKGLEQLHHDL